MAVELIGHRLRAAYIIQQQITNEIGPAVCPFLKVSDGHIQVVPKLRIGREIFIDSGYSRFAICFTQKKFRVSLQQFAKGRLSWEQGLC